MTGTIRSILRFAGKGDTRVAAVFGLTAEGCRRAVDHLREGAPEIPIWLFSTVEPLPETASICEHICVRRGSWALFVQAERLLWPRWVTITVAPWTGEHGGWPVKLAPFLIPPFRALLLNSFGDFLPGTPGKVVSHAWRRLRDICHTGWHTALDYGRAYWKLVSYDVWRSGPVTRFRDNSRGLFALAATWCLALIALPMRWFGYPYRRLFRRMHGSEALAVEPAPPAGSGAVRFSPTGTHWDWRKLDSFARSNDARWIAWVADAKSQDDTAGLFALFEDSRTFAVARQTSFRAWKALLFPTAPFRTLQKGEASQVLAPLSDTIVVDRAKLLALGIPHCSLVGRAWMLLFWKAAAAGWRCYSVGEGKPLAEQPDLPMHETGFFLSFLLSGRLRRLGPREPELSRGAMAFAPEWQRRPVPSSRPRVLLVSPFLPFPLSHGGAVRIYNLCRALRDRVDFILAAIREEHDHVDYARLGEVFREIYVVDKDQRPSTDASLPQQVREHESSALRALIAEVARSWKPDALQIEYTHLAALRDAAPDVPAILVEHDLTFSLYRQLASRPGAGEAAQLEYERWLKFERRWLGAYDTVWTVSEDDREIAAREGARDPERTCAILNGVDIERFTPGGTPAIPQEILYVGSFRHLPNILGFEKLCDEVMPRVWQRCPEVRLRVVAGPQHEDFWRRFVKKSVLPRIDPRVEMHGFVEDLRPLYAAATVVVVPLQVSAGTNIKVLEAMACGKSVVTTPVGCAGLGLYDRRDVWIDAEWPAFAASVVELLRNEGLRTAAGAQARRTAEERFSWTAIAESAYQSYRSLQR